MLQSDKGDCSDVYIVVKGIIVVTDPDVVVFEQKLALKNNIPSLAAFKKLIIHLLVMQNPYTL